MSESLWCDLTTEDASGLAEYYVKVMGWKTEAVSMGDYQDYVMMKPDGTPVGGICHKKGCNAQAPKGWIPYFTVDNLDDALATSLRLGGSKVGDIRQYGDDRFCIVTDPSGVSCGLYESQQGKQPTTTPQ